jgi:hypothetical protein
MTSKLTRFLNNIDRGPKGVVGNFQHATRIFVDNNYRLAPRTKFLYYAVFTGAEREVSLLIKSTDLPKFNFDMANKNVYNRTKQIYKNGQHKQVFGIQSQKLFLEWRARFLYATVSITISFVR